MGYMMENNLNWRALSINLITFVAFNLISFGVRPTQAADSCQTANWWSSFNNAGWSKCPSTFPFINGLYRSRANQNEDLLNHLEDANCCDGGFSSSECVQTTDWEAGFDRNEHWNLCPSGYYLSGLRRSASFNSGYLGNIEQAWCCKPRGAQNSYESCYDKDVSVSFDWYGEGMVSCLRPGHYITGLYRSQCNLMYCLDQFRCCSFKKVFVPAPLTGIIATASKTSVNLTWTIPGPAISSYITQYIIYLDGIEKKIISREKYGSQFTLRGLKPNTSYTVGIRTQDGSLQMSNQVSLRFRTEDEEIGSCLAEQTGENITRGIFLWKKTGGNVWISTDCPYGDINNGTNFVIDSNIGRSRYCECNDDDCERPSWLEPDISQCKYRVYNDSIITTQLSFLKQDLEQHRMSTVDASIRLVNLTSYFQNFRQDDVSLTVLNLEDIVRKTNVLNETGKYLTKAIDNFLNVDPDILSRSQLTTNSSARVLLVVEEYLKNVPIKSGEEVQQNEANIALFSRDTNQSRFHGAVAVSLNGTKGNEEVNNFTVYNNEFTVDLSTTQVSLTMPKSLFDNLSFDSKDQHQRMSFVLYRELSLFNVKHLNSWVISGSIKGRKLTNLQDPIILTYQPLRDEIHEYTKCVFWDFTLKNGVGDWSQVGCTYHGTKDGIATCHCSHLTNFAILTDVYIEDRLDSGHEKALSIISYIGCALSLCGLVLTIITFAFFKDLRTKVPFQILLNFCIALSLTLIVFMVAAERSKTSSITNCRAAAIALHYFLLAVFMWMAINAYNMYLAFVKILPTYHSHFMIKSLIAGWGLPAVIVFVTAVSVVEEYGDNNYCRLQGVPFQVAFLVPVLLILLVNSVAFALIMRSLLASGTKVTSDQKISGLTQARRAIAILVLMGLTWLFGFLAIDDAKMVFQSLFCIFNSLQGLLVFVFYCVVPRETRGKWIKLLCSKKEPHVTSSSPDHGSSHTHEIPVHKFDQK